VTANWQTGNANEDGADTRGWLVGHFIDPSQGVRSQKDVEIKWCNHPAGDKRIGWTSDDQRTTLTMLVQGVFHVETTEGHFTMARPGDYVMWGMGVDHSWEALEESTVLTVRWPSQA
jgi:hypothetical protein